IPNIPLGKVEQQYIIRIFSPDYTLQHLKTHLRLDCLKRTQCLYTTTVLVLQ
ncbi:uncharacterized protein F5147DRAFT_586682, partial [Suillus discolor]